MLNPVHFLLRFALAFCVAMVGMTWASSSHAATQAVDVFGQPVQSASAVSADSADSTAADRSASEPEAAPVTTRHEIALPGFIRTVLVTSIVWQGKLNARIEDTAQRLYRPASLWTWLTLLGFAFAYGALHAVGPGHGKLVAGTWLGSRDTRVIQAVSLAAWTATVQALSAVALVFGAAWFAKEGMSTVLSNAASLDIASYALLCVAGGWTIYSTLMQRDCCASPGTLKIVPDSSSDDGSSGDEPAYLGKKLQFHAAQPVSASAPQRSRFSAASQIFATGFASGVRPCVGSIFVLIASVAAHAPWVGIAATFAIGAGVAVTVTLFGLGSIGANRFIMARGIRFRARLDKAKRVVAVSGALLIMLFGATQTVLILTGYIQPAIT
jgi:nickel/cobalt transporter (NicO) family protein